MPLQGSGGPRKPMWNVEEIELVPVELDFSSSGQGRRAATAVDSGGVRLCNALELVDVQDAVTQVEVCECCGYPGCSPAGWVAFRRAGEHVVWLPAWDEMEKGEWEASEYRPPSFLGTIGAPVFSPSSWERLRGVNAALPRWWDLPVLDSREAARACQWAAPGRLLGEYPSVPRVRRDLILAATEGEPAAEIDAIDRCLQEHFGAPKTMALVPAQVAIRPIELWLDLLGTPGWKRLAHVGEQIGFLVGKAAALVRAGNLDRPSPREGT